MSWSGLFEVTISTIATLFVGIIIWRKRTEPIPSTAFWCFAILVLLVVILPTLQEIATQLQALDIRLGGERYSISRKELTKTQAQLAELKAKVEPAKSATWVLFREGDCGDNDIPPPTAGDVPDNNRCNLNNANTSAVCWDGVLYGNTPSPTGTVSWCTYKTTPPAQCHGGGRPGRIYRCQPS
jgi:hypothetical protein